MLVLSRQSSDTRSRLTGMGSVIAGLLTFVLSDLPQGVVQAQARPGRADAKTNGRIYACAVIQYEGKDRLDSLVIAIDPDTGKWQKITDQAHDCRVSPDRQTLVFFRDDGIWNCDTTGNNAVGKVSDMRGLPIWSRNGKYVVTTEPKALPEEGDKPRTKPAWKNQTWKMDADGRSPVKLPIPDTDTINDWSPDGTWFVTSSDRHKPFGSGYQLYLMKTDGTEQRRLTKGGLNVHARFSPDGKKILYLRQTGKDGNSIWIVDATGKNAREIVKEVNLAAPHCACWSPNGKQLAVVLFDWTLNDKGAKVVTGKEDPNFRIEIVDADGKNRRELKLQGGKFKFIGSLGDWR